MIWRAELEFRFAAGDIEGALAHWLAGREKLADAPSVDGDRVVSTALAVALHTNIAVGMAKLGNWREASSAASSALALDPKHLKVVKP